VSLLTSQSAARRAHAASDFGKVAVLLGGDSTEREISLLSGNAVLAALKRRGVDAHAFDPRDIPVQKLASERFDRAWIALHGPGGEDGVMQGALEWFGHPLHRQWRARLGAHHGQAQDQARGGGVPATSRPNMRCCRAWPTLAGALASVGLPLMVKPASQGSSVGITKVKTAAEFQQAFAEASAVDPIVFAERFISGDEYTVGVLQAQALPSIRIQPATEFYDYQAKYFRNDTQYHLPERAVRRG